MKKRKIVINLLVFLGLFVFGENKNLFAQELSVRDSIRVFLDCKDCDQEHIKQNILFVNYVDDRKNADLHILITSRRTGGGSEYLMQFIGLGLYAKNNNRIVLSSSSTDTDDELRKKLVKNLEFGLLPYIGGTNMAEKISVTYTQGSEQDQNKKDPWNYWLFNISGYGSIWGEERSSYSYGYGSVSANRVTEKWKIETGSTGTLDNKKYTLPDDSNVKSSQKSFSVNSSVIKSLGGHGGLGGGFTFKQNGFYNLGPSYKAVAAIEYNLFPYKKSSDRIFAVTYTVGFANLNYKEQTIFGELNQKLFTQGIDTNFTTKRPWGDASLSLTFNQIGKPEFLRLAGSGGVSWRIFRGLSFTLNGKTTLIRDQIYLSANGLTSEEILLQQRAQATGFDYYFGAGFKLQFGSIYNSIVNGRLDRAAFNIF